MRLLTASVTLPPKGTVCDKCNNGPLSLLDAALIDFTPVAIMRTIYNVPTKSGGLPSTKLSNATLSRSKPNQIDFQTNSQKAFVPKGDTGFVANMRGNRRMLPPYCKTITRALFKMTMGCMYLDRPTKALSKRFDPVRRIVLDEEDFQGYFTLVQRKVIPNGPHWGCRLVYDELDVGGEKTVWTRFDYYHISLFTDLETRRPQKPMLHPGDCAHIFKF